MTRTLHVCIDQYNIHVHSTTRRELRKGEEKRVKTSRNGKNVSIPRGHFVGYHKINGSDMKIYIPETPEGVDPLVFSIGVAVMEMQKLCGESEEKDKLIAK